MDYQKKLILTELLILNAYHAFPVENTRILWSGGKESTLLIYFIRKLFNERVPYTVIFADSTLEHPEVYAFIESISKKWKLKLRKFTYATSKTLRMVEDNFTLAQKYLHVERKKISRKLSATEKVVLTMSGVRWYEHFHKVNSYLTRGNNQQMYSLYPLLHWTLEDVWRYSKENNIPHLSFYDKGCVHVGPFSGYEHITQT